MKEVVRALIYKVIDEFWVCYEGNFDWISRMVMSRIKEEFQCRIFVCFVCAYNPNKYSKTKQEWLSEHYEIIYTDEMADGPPQFAIKRRNKYIADNVDYIICYIEHNSGGAYKAVKQARKNGKKIINITKII